jgi:Tfp pilus assembly protein FimV
MNAEFILIVGIVVVLGFVIFKLSTTQKGNDEALDPLAEAQVYVAYGRKNQAIELLEKALQQNPARADIATKLRELKSK